MHLTFTLQAAYTGATYVAGPFNITGVTSDGVAHELAINVAKSELVTGYGIDTALETLTGGTIQSTGTCGTSQPWFVGTPPAPQPTGNEIQLYRGTQGGTGTACVNALANIFNQSVYHPTDTVLVDGHTYYDVNGFPFVGSMNYFSDGIMVGRITYQGLFTEETLCVA